MNNYNGYNNYGNYNANMNVPNNYGNYYPAPYYPPAIPVQKHCPPVQDADKKRLKKYSNAMTVPLILTQIIAVFAVIAAIIAYIAIQSVVFHNPISPKLLNDFIDSMSGENNSAVNNTLSTLIYFSYMFIPLMMIAAILRQNPLKVTPFKFKARSLVFPAIITGMFLSVIGEFYSDYFNSILSLFHLSVNLSEFNFPNNIPAQVVYFIQVAIFAPFCEEFIFRGIILTNLRKYGNLFAVIVSSALFGILHGNFAQTPFAFLVGVGLALAVIETGSIWVSISIHFIVNGTSTAFSAISYYMGDNKANIIYGIYMGVTVLLFIGVLIYLKRKKLYKEFASHYITPENTKPEKNVFSLVRTFVATPGCIIFIAFFCLSMLLTLKWV